MVSAWTLEHILNKSVNNRSHPNNKLLIRGGLPVHTWMFWQMMLRKSQNLAVRGVALSDATENSCFGMRSPHTRHEESPVDLSGEGFKMAL